MTTILLRVLNTEEDEDEKPCYREWDVDGWWCVNDHTGCIYNDGNNTCMAEGESNQPLEGEK